MNATTTAAARPPMPRTWRRFARHYGEMVLVMFAGMAVLGIAAEVVAGARLGDASAPFMATIMAFNMTAPMVAWMHLRHRMAPARSVEMAGSMIVPTIVAIALYGLGVIASDSVLAIQHVMMLPSMLAAMLWRREAYSH